MDKKDKRKKILKVSGLIGLFLIVFGLSYALFTVTLNGTKKVKIKTGKLELQLLDSNNNPIYVTGQNSESSYAINLDNQVPVSDESGLGQDGFTFKLKNSGNVKAKYTIYLDDVALEEGESRIDDQYVKYSLTKNGTESTPALLSTTVTENERQLDKGTIETDNTTNTYTLKIWIAEDATNEAMDKVFNATLRVEAVQYVNTTGFEDGTAAAQLYANGVVAEYNATTAKVPNGFDSENEEDGLIKYTDAEGTETYVYRGIDVNNYVTFAESTWRIVRIQDDGTIKLIKEDLLNFDSDKVAYSNNGYKSVRYNNSYDNDDYSKYANSNIEGYVNEWYQATMTSYNSKIALNDYCSDRTEDHNSTYYQAFGSDYTTLYGIWNRLDFGGWNGQGEPTAQQLAAMSWAPSVSCRAADKVNARSALITADEYVLAGGGAGDFSNYLVKDNSYWTMSPAGFDDGSAISYDVNSTGSISYDYVNYSYGVRPVITLNASATISSGEGTALSPYVIG